MGGEGKHQGLPICGSEHALFLLRKHLGALEACPLNYSPPSCWFSGISSPHENGCLERAPLSKQVVRGGATIVGLNEQFLNWISSWCRGLGSPESKD